jgi:LDH2 family malate/lactate/ureidoglycolate dehydrogenase/D-alanine-D-alanine ligase-like ATP-grasp enzyme
MTTTFKSGATTFPFWTPAIMLLNAGRFRIQRLAFGRVSGGVRRMKSERAAFYETLWRAASAATGTSMTIGVRGLIEMRRGELCLRARENEIQIDDSTVLNLAGDKLATHRLLSQGGLPVPRQIVVTLGEYDRALSHLRAYGGPLVVKPAAATGGGAGVTTNVFTDAQLRLAMARSRTYGADILIEEQIEGDCYRVLFMDGKHIDTILRRPPAVVGDGRSTIWQLLREENKRRIEQGAARSHVLIAADLDLANTLARQGLGLWSRPAAGAVVRLKQVINQNALQENAPAGELLCPDIIAAARKAAEFVGLRLAGVDIICRDPSRSLGAGGGAIIEVNGEPSFYCHNVGGRGPSIAKRILEAYFGVLPEVGQPVRALAQTDAPAVGEPHKAGARTTRQPMETSAPVGRTMADAGVSGGSVALELNSRIESLQARGRVTASELADLVFEIFVLGGLDRPKAQRAAHLMVEAQRQGIDSHGIAFLPIYVRRMRLGGIDVTAEASFTQTGPSTGIMDGRNGYGVLVADGAVQAAVKLARESGIGVVAVRNSNHFGAAAPHVRRVAEEGLIALAFSNASPAMAPWGAREKTLGTNPIAAAFPRGHGRPPVVIDMATSAVARARIRQAQRNNETIPLDWALDASGAPTADPNAAVLGTMLPIGGAKGFALAVMIELLSTALSGGRPGYSVLNPHERPESFAGNSHLFVVLNPANFAGTALAEAAVERLGQKIEQSEPVSKERPPRMPGSRAAAEVEHRTAHGIPMPKTVCDPLREALAIVSDARAG